jgi:hypothetical protein
VRHHSTHTRTRTRTRTHTHTHTQTHTQTHTCLLKTSHSHTQKITSLSHSRIHTLARVRLPCTIASAQSSCETRWCVSGGSNVRCHSSSSWLHTWALGSADVCTHAELWALRRTSAHTCRCAMHARMHAPSHGRTCSLTRTHSRRRMQEHTHDHSHNRIDSRIQSLGLPLGLRHSRIQSARSLFPARAPMHSDAHLDGPATITPNSEPEKSRMSFPAARAQRMPRSPTK